MMLKPLQFVQHTEPTRLCHSEAMGLLEGKLLSQCFECRRVEQISQAKHQTTHRNIFFRMYIAYGIVKKPHPAPTIIETHAFLSSSLFTHVGQHAPRALHSTRMSVLI